MTGAFTGVGVHSLSSADENRCSWFSVDLIIVGTGRYSFMGSTLCTVRPVVNLVDVHYQDSSSLFNSSFPSLINNTRSWNMTESRWLGQFVLDIFNRGIINQGQNSQGSTVGDVVRGIVGSLSTGPPDATHVPRILEAYIRGVMEFSVTVSV